MPLKKKTTFKSKEQKRYENLLSTINSNLKKRDKNKINEEWRKTYAVSLQGTNLHNTRQDWAKGSTGKKSIFEATEFRKTDTEKINKKRKALGIKTSIEDGDKIAIEQAKEKATRVAIVCHKSSYQYIGEGKDAKDYGKKTSQLE